MLRLTSAMLTPDYIGVDHSSGWRMEAHERCNRTATPTIWLLDGVTSSRTVSSSAAYAQTYRTGQVEIAPGYVIEASTGGDNSVMPTSGRMVSKRIRWNIPKVRK